MPTNFGNSFIKALILSPFHFLLGPNTALVTVTGRKTGSAISTPVNVTRDGNLYVATSIRTRTWWRNLRGGAIAQLHVSGQTIQVHGVVIETTGKITEELRRYFERNPQLAKYFNIRLDTDQKPIESDLQRAATERVAIRLQPIP